MEFISTRSDTKVSLHEAVFSGLAADGGLYQPATHPCLERLFGAFNRRTPFLDIASETTQALFEPHISRPDSIRITRSAFPFAPVVRSVDTKLHFLELYHGPTCAFKDFGASFLASLMEELAALDDKKTVILVATSGDTGSAVARAFYRKRNLDVVLLYPSGRVSGLQEKQFTTFGQNIHALEVKGSFDDCQRMVKATFQDPGLKETFRLTSANSINCGRLLPQSFYYIFAISQLADQDAQVRMSVPSGNFGNLTAGVYAWRWGLKVRGFIAATNVNDIVPQYLSSGRFAPRSSVPTLSNAMDVGNPSNFERLTTLFDNDHQKMNQLVQGESVSDQQTLQAISSVYERYGLLIDPHTAVAYAAAMRRSAATGCTDDHIMVLSTAHPAKFCETVEKATGTTPTLPPSLAEALGLPKRSTPIGNRPQELAEYLVSNICA